MKQIQATQLAQWLAQVEQEGDGAQPPMLLDVREPWEFAHASITGSTHMPMQTVPAQMQSLDPEQPIVCICHHGARSAHVAMFLEQHGFSHVLNLLGGIDAWSNTVDPRVPRY